MSNEIQNLLDEIKNGLVLIKTSGNNPIEYYGIKGADIELIEKLADERDAHDQYQALPTVSIQSSKRLKRLK